MPLSGEYAPSTADWARKQAESYESSGGAKATELRGMPVIVLTTVGAKTGMLRKTALMRVEHDGEYAVVGSLGGAPKHPLWVHNIRKQPHVELQDGPEKHDYIARETEGDERAEWWKRAVAAYPPYADYQLKTERVIPVFLLTRTPE
jgi:deazaflavin-dependent oxidoreductase (nitroreductase family)